MSVALAAVIGNVTAQLAMKAASGQGNSSRYYVLLALALACYGASFWFTLKVYAANPLTVAGPIMAGAIFLLTPLLAALFFAEVLTVTKVAGIALILSGIALLSRSS